MSKDLTNSASVAQIDKRLCFSIPARPLSVDVGILDLEPDTEILISTSLAGLSGRAACKAKDAIEEIERTIKRQGMDHYTMREIAEIMAAAHNLDACDFLKTRMQPAFESGALKLLDPKDGGLVKERQCRKDYDWVTPANLDKWLETEFEYRWPVEVPVVAGSSSDSDEVKSGLQWWQESYNIPELWQNIGAKLYSEQKRASNSAIAKEIEKRINDIERNKGRSRKAPNHDTIRGLLTGWVWRPE